MPLYRLSHLADFYVCVDWTITETQWEQAFQLVMDKQTPANAGLERCQIANPKGVYYERLEAEIGPDESGRPLAIMDNLPWSPVEPGAPLPPAWGKLVKLQRNVGKMPRSIWMLFICGSPLHVYKRLFIDQKITPQAIFLTAPHEFALVEEAADAQQQAWQTFTAYGGDLTRLIEQSGARLPEFLISSALAANWPHHFRWQLVKNLGGMGQVHIESAPHTSWPHVQTVAEPGARRVVVTRKPMNPQAAKDVDAVVITHRQLEQYRWPEHVTVIVGAGPAEHEPAVEEGPKTVLCPIAGLPFMEAMGRIEQLCEQRGLWRVAAQFFGYEDEAPALGLWRQQAGAVKELTFHVDDDGTFVSFGAVADQID